MLSPQETPSAQALPPRRACEPCRRKKTRCDMERPRCGLCQRTALVCDYPTKRKSPTISGNKRRTVSSLSEQHLDLLVRFLEDSPRLRKPASPEESSEKRPPLPSDIAVCMSPPHYEQQNFSPNEDLGVHAVPGPSPEDCDGAPNHVAYGSENTPQEQLQKVSHPLAVHLVEVFFERIAPWLPLLHKPRFLRRCEYILSPGPDALVNASSEDRILLLSMFALAARHSTMDLYSSIPFLERGRIYAQEANEIYLKAGSFHLPNFRSLQGCLVLAYYFHTSGLSPQGFIVVGVCVQMAMDLDLPRLDEDDALLDEPLDLFSKEERRRAWWVTWDLDTFGSILLLRPFGIDQRHVSVRLPISDENWFSEIYIESEIIRLDREIDWAAMCSSPNQDNRAWYIVTNTLLARVHDRLLLKRPLSVEERATFENEISCLKFAMPPMSRSGKVYLDRETDVASKNWIMGSQLLLSATAQLVHRASQAGQPQNKSQNEDESALQKDRVLETSAILRMWPPECLPSAHPFWSHALCPMLATPLVNIMGAPTYRSFRNLCGLIVKRLAEKWALGQRALQIIHLTDQDLNQYPELVKRYPFYAKPYLRAYDTSMDQTSSSFVCTSDEASRDITFGTPILPAGRSDEPFVLDPHTFDITGFDVDTSHGEKFNHPALDGATNDMLMPNDLWTQVPHRW